MKSLENAAHGAQWQNAILKDLAFIKKKRRYPFNSRTLAPGFIIAFGLLLALWVSWSTLISGKNKLMPFFILGLVIITVITSAIRYLRLVRFSTVTSAYPLSENIKAIKYFLKAQQLAFAQHPDAPEVFSIISMPIGSSGDKREVMFFIADQHRILINSHFTEQKFVITPPSGHSRQMAAKLSKWLQSPGNPITNTSITPVNTL